MLLLVAADAGGRHRGRAVVGAVAGIGAFVLLRTWQSADAPAQSLSEANQTPAAVDTLPSNPDFVICRSGLDRARSTPGATRQRRRRSASRRRCATRSRCSTPRAPPAQRPAPVALDLAVRHRHALVAGVDPRVTIPRRGLSTIGDPGLDPRPDRRPTSTR